MHSQNTFWDDCGNGKNANKKPFLHWKLSNIMWPGKSNIFFSELNLNYIWTINFSSKRAVCYLVDQFHYYLLIEYIITLAMLKRQWFKDSESDEMQSSVSNRQQLDMHDDEEGQGLDKYKSEAEGERYVFFSLYCSSSSSSKGVKPPNRSGWGNKEPKLPCIHIKNLLLREMLNLH